MTQTTAEPTKRKKWTVVDELNAAGDDAPLEAIQVDWPEARKALLAVHDSDERDGARFHAARELLRHGHLSFAVNEACSKQSLVSLLVQYGFDAEQALLVTEIVDALTSDPDFEDIQRELSCERSKVAG